MNLIKLIEIVKKHSNIYKNLQVDEEEYGLEWQKVAKELEKVEQCSITADEAQDQWNVALVEYMDYLRGNQDFALAKHMDFLQPHLFTIIEDDAALDEEELSNIIAEVDGGQKCHNEKKTNPPIKEQNSQDDIHVMPDTIPVTLVSAQNTIPVPAPPQPAENRTTQNDASFSNLSSMELIFLGYAKQLQKMPLTLQLQTKRKIADIMDEAELKMMEDALKG